MRQVHGTRNEPVCSASTLPGPGISSVGWQGFSSLPRAMHGQQQGGALKSLAFKSRLCFCMCVDEVSSDPLSLTWSSSSLHSPILARTQCYKKHLDECIMSRGPCNVCWLCLCLFQNSCSAGDGAQGSQSFAAIQWGQPSSLCLLPYRGGGRTLRLPTHFCLSLNGGGGCSRLALQDSGNKDTAGSQPPLMRGTLCLSHC